MDLLLALFFATAPMLSARGTDQKPYRDQLARLGDDRLPLREVPRNKFPAVRPQSQASSRQVPTKSGDDWASSWPFREERLQTDRPPPPTPGMSGSSVPRAMSEGQEASPKSESECDRLRSHCEAEENKKTIPARSAE
eukprot:s1928_g10.t2